MAVEITINQNIKITRAAGKEWCASNVQDVSSGSFCISIPTLGAHPLVLHEGDAVKISFVSENARYEFETKVVGRRYDNIPMYELALPKEYKRMQLREFVRISFIMEMEYAEVPDEGMMPVFTKCTCLDLSGGGIRLLLKKYYPVGTELILKFIIPFKNDKEKVEIKGRVIRSWQDRNMCQSAVQFKGISRRLQDLIVRFILLKMSEQRRLS